MLKTYNTPRSIQQVNEEQSYGFCVINPMAFPPPGYMFHSHEDQNDHLPSTSSLSSLPSCPPQLFPGGGGGGGGHFMMKRSMSFSGLEKCEGVEVNGDDDLSDDGSQLGEKKKRLNLEQVKALEKSFELGIKLEPERKMQLAKALGLQPRQIAIWFQNRRAKWRTKQLEKDYEALKKRFDALKADHDVLQTHNKKLHAELLALKGRDSSETNLKKGAEGPRSNGIENSCDVNLDNSRTPVEASPASCQLSTKHFLTTSVRPNSMTHQLPQGSSRSDLQCLKVDHQLAQDENFCNIFNGIYEQQQGFWPWPEQHAHHFH